MWNKMLWRMDQMPLENDPTDIKSRKMNDCEGEKLPSLLFCGKLFMEHIDERMFVFVQ